MCNRKKQEENERRCVEEKARHDAISEKYVQRKMMADGTGVVEQPLPPVVAPTPLSAPVLLCRKPGMPARLWSVRPMSQLPPASAEVQLAVHNIPVEPSVVRGVCVSDKNLLDSDAEVRSREFQLSPALVT